MKKRKEKKVCKIHMLEEEAISGGPKGGIEKKN